MKIMKKTIIIIEVDGIKQSLKGLACNDWISTYSKTSGSQDNGREHQPKYTETKEQDWRNFY